MCGPISSSRMSFVAAEMARVRRVAQGAPITAPPAVSPITAVSARALQKSVRTVSTRAVEIRTPLGTLTFIEPVRAPRVARPTAMEILHRQIADVVARFPRGRELARAS